MVSSLAIILADVPQVYLRGSNKKGPSAFLALRLAALSCYNLWDGAIREPAGIPLQIPLGGCLLGLVHGLKHHRQQQKGKMYFMFGLKNYVFLSCYFFYFILPLDITLAIEY